MEIVMSVLVVNETFFITRACGVFVNVLENELVLVRMWMVVLECVMVVSMLSRDIFILFVMFVVLFRVLEVLKKKDLSMRIKFAALRLCRVIVKVGLVFIWCFVVCGVFFILVDVLDYGYSGNGCEFIKYVFGVIYIVAEIERGD